MLGSEVKVSATADQIAQVRRMVAEPTTTTYTDLAIKAAIERYPQMDEFGQEPWIWTVVDGVKTRSENDDWVDTYDLNAAAAEIWQEKSGTLTATTDFSADGGNYSDSQKYSQAMSQARFYLSRRSAKTVRLIKWPLEGNESDEPSSN